MISAALRWLRRRFGKQPLTKFGDYQIVNYAVRPRDYALVAAVGADDTMIQLTDVTSLMPGDILELSDGGDWSTERVEVLSRVDEITVRVRRGVEGTIAQTRVDPSCGILLVGNIRSGTQVF